MNLKKIINKKLWSESTLTDIFDAILSPYITSFIITKQFFL